MINMDKNVSLYEDQGSLWISLKNVPEDLCIPLEDVGDLYQALRVYYGDV